MTQEQILAALSALVDAAALRQPVSLTVLNDAREAVRLLTQVGFQ